MPPYPGLESLPGRQCLGPMEAFSTRHEVQVMIRNWLCLWDRKWKEQGIMVRARWMIFGLEGGSRRHGVKGHPGLALPVPINMNHIGCSSDGPSSEESAMEGGGSLLLWSLSRGWRAICQDGVVTGGLPWQGRF